MKWGCYANRRGSNRWYFSVRGLFFIGLFGWGIYRSKYPKRPAAHVADVIRRLHSLTILGARVGILRQPTVDRPPRSAVVIPPLFKKRLPASRAGEMQRQIPNNDRKDHPRNRDHERRSERREQTHRKHSDTETDRHIAEEGEPGKISSSSVLVPNVRSRHFNASLAQVLMIVVIRR